MRRLSRCGRAEARDGVAIRSAPAPPRAAANRARTQGEAAAHMRANHPARTADSCEGQR